MRYKPFMWCRSDVRLWHSCHLLSIYALYVMSLRRPIVALLSFTFDISPLCDVAQTSDCGTHCRLYSIISPLCGVALMPDCGIVNLFVPFRGVISETRLAFSITLEFREDYRPTSLLFPMHGYLIVWVRSINLFICIMFTFVISYVRTVLRVLS